MIFGLVTVVSYFAILVAFTVAICLIDHSSLSALVVRELIFENFIYRVAFISFIFVYRSVFILVHSLLTNPFLTLSLEVFLCWWCFRPIWLIHGLERCHHYYHTVNAGC